MTRKQFGRRPVGSKKRLLESQLQPVNHSEGCLAPGASQRLKAQLLVLTLRSSSPTAEMHRESVAPQPCLHKTEILLEPIRSLRLTNPSTSETKNWLGPPAEGVHRCSRDHPELTDRARHTQGQAHTGPGKHRARQTQSQAHTQDKFKRPVSQPEASISARASSERLKFA